MLTAVITGDMIDSKSLTHAERDIFIDLLSNLGNRLAPITNLVVEIFRGDSFQLKVSNPLDVLKSAIIIRSLFRMHCSQGNQQWDCRVSIGIGQTEFDKITPGISDGEAYRLSGYGLDEMKKSRLIINTPWQDINNELLVSTAFADDIISHWTVKQSEVSFNKLLSLLPNTGLAATLHVSRQSIDKLVNAAKFNLIELYLNRFHQILADKL